VSSDGRVVNRNGRDFGWEIAHAAVSRRPPISLSTTVARTHMCTYDAEILGCVHRSRSIFCRAVPSPNDTIRNFFTAVWRGCWVRRVPGAGGGAERHAGVDPGRRAQPGGVAQVLCILLPAERPRSFQQRACSPDCPPSSQQWACLADCPLSFRQGACSPRTLSRPSRVNPRHTSPTTLLR
jgi:hypothetical protein